MKKLTTKKKKKAQRSVPVSEREKRSVTVTV